MLGLWQIAYPDHSDPKNLRYQLWKMRCATFNLDEACGTMIGDTSREKLVLGKSKSQLEQRFGFLTKPEEAGPYLGGFYKKSSWNGRDVLFIRHSPWMVVFENGKASDLVLVKGA